MIFVNFKNYQEATAENALHMAQIHEKAMEETKTPIVLVVNPIDLVSVKKMVSIPVWAQHADPVEYGTSVGKITPAHLKKIGIEGTVLNHSASRIPFLVLKDTVEMCKNIGLKIMICAQDESEIEKFSQLEPDFLAYEPPELIGSTESSVLEKKADIIEKALIKAHKIPLIIGAGIKTPNDIEKTKNIGAKGVFVASGIIKSETPSKKILSFAKAFQ